MNRRDALKAIGGGALALGAGKAVDNVLVGYGVLVGTNLRDQDLAAVVGERLEPATAWDAALDAHRLQRRGDRLRVLTPGGGVAADLSLSGATPSEAAAVDADLGLPGGPCEEVVADCRALRDGEFSFAFSEFEAFFDRLDGSQPRPYTADLLRGRRTADPESVVAFTGADPADPRETLVELAEAFRQEVYYDVARYAAGSVQDNVLMKAVDLRQQFRSDVSFDGLADDAAEGMFCYEFTNRSIEAVQAVPAYEQAVPVLGGGVVDDRHKHVYTAVGSAMREDGDLVVPVTFVDYTHTTMYDDFDLRGILGDGFEAYNERHRATDVFW